MRPWFGLGGAEGGGNSGRGRGCSGPWLRPCRQWQCRPRWPSQSWRDGQSGTQTLHACTSRAGTRGTPTAQNTTRLKPPLQFFSIGVRSGDGGGRRPERRHRGGSAPAARRPLPWRYFATTAGYLVWGYWNLCWAAYSRSTGLPWGGWLKRTFSIEVPSSYERDGSGAFTGFRALHRVISPLWV